MMTVVDWWKSREVVLLVLDEWWGWQVAQCGNVGKVAAVGLIGCYGAEDFLGGAQFLQSFNNGCSQGNSGMKATQVGPAVNRREIPPLRG